MAKQPRTLAGRVVAITGGARGIGRATATAMRAEGMKVAIGDLDHGLAQRAAEEIGGGTAAFELNVTDRASFERFIDGVEEQLGPLDVLVNNAGIMPVGPFVEEDDASARRQIDINVHGVLYGMKIVLPRFLARGSGHVVNLASMAGKAGFPGAATYSGTKHFVVGVSEAVRQELRGTSVEISCVMPALVRTELTSGVTMEARAVKTVTPEEVAAEIVDALKAPRFDVYVPRSVGRITQATLLLPRRGREAIARALKADRVLTQIDAGARRAYELRAAQSEPGLEPGDQPKQLTETTQSS
jgi:NADP-dependent 3-hydroxy acid dehydrogenase YdfG